MRRLVAHWWTARPAVRSMGATPQAMPPDPLGAGAVSKP